MFGTTKKQLVICLVAAVLVVGFLLLRYFPLRRRAQMVEQARTEHKLALAEMRSRSKQLSVLDRQLHDLRLQVGDYDQRIPQQRGLAAFLQTVSDLMDEHQLADQQVLRGSEMEVDSLGCIPLTVQCRGTLKQVFGFYKELQGLQRLVRVELVKLENNDAFTGTVSMETEAVVYYRRDKEQS